MADSNRRAPDGSESTAVLTDKWHIRLLGTFEVKNGELQFTRCLSTRAEVLLAYLAWNLGKSFSRSHLADLLWQDRDLSVGLTNLRVALNGIRNQLEPVGVPRYSILRNEGSHRVSLNPDCVVCDVVEFRKLLAKSPHDTPETRRNRLIAALDLYQGPLMPAHTAPAVDAIVDDERQRLEGELWDAMQELSELIKTSSDVEQKLKVLRRLADENPYDDEVQKELINLLGMTGRHQELMQHFQRLERIYRAEGDDVPPEVRDAYQRTTTAGGSVAVRPPGRGRHRRVAPEGREERSEPAWPLVPGLQRPVPPLPEPKRTGTIPLPVTRFFGREDEIATLRALVEKGEDRLITLTGPGGTGKTRLAVEFARRLSGEGTRNVDFVSLADLETAEQIPGEIARALRIPILEGSDVLSQVCAYLSREPWLLVLDNLEQVATGAAMLIMEILQRVPSLIILATSRHALNVLGEQQMPVEPLPVPTSVGTPERLMEFASVQLFIDRASHMAPELRVTERNAGQIVRLCQELEGLPLSLELAAGWASELSVSQMVARLASKFQPVLARLSVFRGGWTLEAMQAVCDVPNELAVIAELRGRSFITVDRSREETRYGMLEIVREFAETKLNREDAAFLANRHASYYARLAEDAKPHLRGDDQAFWLERLSDEQANLHAALRWALTNSPQMGLHMAEDLFFYWAIRGQWTEARSLLNQAIETARAHGGPADLALMTMFAGIAAREDGDVKAGLNLAQESVELWRKTGSRTRLAAALLNLGVAQAAMGQIEEAIRTNEDALALADAEHQDEITAGGLTNAAAAHLTAGDVSAARRASARALELYERLQDPWAASLALLNLGDIACQEDDACQAWRSYRRALPAFLATGDYLHGAHVLRQLAAVAAYLQRWRDAATLAGAAVAVQERTGRRIEEDEAEALADTIQAAEMALPSDRFQSAWANGASLSPHEIGPFVQSLPDVD